MASSAGPLLGGGGIRQLSAAVPAALNVALGPGPALAISRLSNALVMCLGPSYTPGSRIYTECRSTVRDVFVPADILARFAEALTPPPAAPAEADGHKGLPGVVSREMAGLEPFAGMVGCEAVGMGRGLAVLAEREGVLYLQQVVLVRPIRRT